MKRFILVLAVLGAAITLGFRVLESSFIGSGPLLLGGHFEVMGIAVKR